MSEQTVATVPDDLKPLSGEALDEAKFAYDTRVALSLGTPLPQRPAPGVVPPYKAHLDAYLANPETVDGSSQSLQSTAVEPTAEAEPETPTPVVVPEPPKDQPSAPDSI